MQILSQEPKVAGCVARQPRYQPGLLLPLVTLLHHLTTTLNEAQIASKHLNYCLLTFYKPKQEGYVVLIAHFSYALNVLSIT